MIRDLIHHSYEDRMKDLRLLTWNRLRGNLTNSHMYLKGRYQVDESGFFQWCPEI